MAEYHCSNFECKYYESFTKSDPHENHNCNYVYKYDDDYEYLKCLCGQDDGLKRPHTFNEAKYDKTKSHVTYTCQTCGYEKTLEHSHDYNEIYARDDYEEHIQCACGLDITRLHTYEYGDWGMCTTCGYTKAQPHQHTESRPTIIVPETPIKDYCYEAVFTCTKCGQEIRRERIPHNIDYDNPTIDFPWLKEYHCKNIDCNYYESVTS